MQKYQEKLFHNVLRLLKTSELSLESGDTKTALYLLVTSLEEALKLDSLLGGKSIEKASFSHKKKFEPLTLHLNSIIEDMLTNPEYLISRLPHIPSERIRYELAEYYDHFKEGTGFYSNLSELRKKLIYLDEDYEKYENLLQHKALKVIYEGNRGILEVFINSFNSHFEK